MPFVPTNDSVIKTSSEGLNKTTPSLFSNHLLKPSSNQPELKVLNTDYWIPGVLFFCFVVFVYLKAQYNKKFNEHLNIFFSARTLSKLSREEYALNNRFSLSMILIFILTSSLFIYQLNNKYNWIQAMHGNEIGIYIKIVLIITGLFFSKIFTLKIIGILFGKPQEAEEQIFNISLFNKITGLFLLPVLICFMFINTGYKNLFIYLVGILFVLMFVYRIVRSFSGYLSDPHFSKFYLFIYLCCLEVIPLVVIIKFFII